MKFNGGPFTSAEQYYVANFWPAGLKLPGIKSGNDAATIVEKNPETIVKNNIEYSKKYSDIGLKIKATSEIAAYKANPGLDADKNGQITFGDIKAVLKRVDGNKNYQSALAEMQKTTGYDVKSKTNNSPDQGKPWYNLHDNYNNGPSNMTKTNINSIENVLDSYLSQIAASEKLNKKLYNKFLPKQKFLISVKSSDYTNGIEFSRVLSSALEEELMASANILCNDRDIEIECQIPGPHKECFAALNGIVDAFHEAFNEATKKIGGVNVETTITKNEPSYSKMSLKTAETQHNKFLLKFL